MLKGIIYLNSLILIFFICIGCSSNEAVDANKLIGIWNQMPDSSSQSFFNGKNSIDYIRGFKQAAYDYTIVDDALIEIDRSTGNKYQYFIVKLTADSLTLKHISSGYERHYWRNKSTVIVQRPN